MEEQRDQRSVPLGLEEPTGLISIDDACQDPCYSSSNSFDYSFISPIFEPDLSLSWSSSFDLSPPWGTSSDLLHSVHETKLLSSAASDIYSLNNPYSFTDLDSNGDSSKYWGTWPEASTLPRPLYNHFDQGSSHLSYEYLAACEPLQSLFHTEPRTNVNDELSLRRCPYSSPAVSSLPTQSPSQCEPPPGWIKSERTHRPLAPVTSEDVTRAHSQPDKEHYCERCDIQFSQRKNLDRHNSAFHTGKAPKEKCHHDSCGKAFHRHDNLVAHLKRYHGDQRQPTRSATFPNPSPKSACSRSPRCNNKAINDNLSSSAPNIPDPKHRPALCCEIKQCVWHEKNFRSLADLRRHERDVHRLFATPDSNHGYICASKLCPSSGKTWSRLDNLRNHIQRVHKDEDIGNLIERSSVPRIALTGRDDNSPNFVFYTSDVG